MNDQDILAGKPEGVKSVFFPSIVKDSVVWLDGNYRSLVDIQALVDKDKRIKKLETTIRYSSDYLDDNKLNSIGHGSKAHNELKHVLSSEDKL